ncbi:dTDP-4-dehydrorhamnose reductase [Curvibacter sp. CHRR-16]|uniref:dTDP-4-dehydrorhamnose reductase n=1 Tax=Curvibacter sp. CHRR-16 TaxID=2835872 RepID=UPI001BDB0CBC|nr:dTDP-4-dehydrorhamnose reductase [Curvibacter sp. CHRR-16]MBT0569390.1 dTDP-4-dehydrorhamnose reductase [Curvibacter sp. CHRR-16]
MSQSTTCPTILLLGCNGQVGWELQRSLSVLGHLVSLGSRSSLNPHGLCGDFTDLVGLQATLDRVQPHIIVNASAYTAVDKAEAEPALATQINATAPALLAEHAAKTGAWLIHFSTDYVFNGQGDRPWQEDDTPAPLSVYGQSKLAGEQAVARHAKHLILRTSWVYASRGGNFAKTMLRLASERDTLRVINDQWGAPTSAELLADVVAQAIPQLQRNPALAGSYHCAATGYTTWFDYARLVLTLAQAHGHTLTVKPELVEAIPTSAYPTPAQRPLNSRLNTHKLQTHFGLQLPHWESGVRRMLTEITGS